MAKSEPSSSYNQEDIIQKVLALSPEIKALVTKKALAALLSDFMMKFEAVLHRGYGDLTLMPNVLHPRYPYMTVLVPLLYAFPTPLMALLRCAMASHTVAIELDVHFLKRVLRLKGHVSEAQLLPWANLLHFLQCLLPLSQWEEHVRDESGCLVLICNRKLHLTGEGQVKYNPTVHEVIHLRSTIYTVGDEFQNRRRAVFQKIWAANNECYPWRSQWDEVDREGPWNDFSLDYTLTLKPRFWEWYMGLTVFDIVINWRYSHVMKGYEEKWKWVLKEYPQVANIFSNEEPWPRILMPTNHLDEGN